MLKRSWSCLPGRETPEQEGHPENGWFQFGLVMLYALLFMIFSWLFICNDGLNDTGGFNMDYGFTIKGFHHVSCMSWRPHKEAVVHGFRAQDPMGGIDYRDYRDYRASPVAQPPSGVQAGGACALRSPGLHSLASNPGGWEHRLGTTLAEDLQRRSTPLWSKTPLVGADWFGGSLGDCLGVSSDLCLRLSTGWQIQWRASVAWERVVSITDLHHCHLLSGCSDDSQVDVRSGPRKALKML